MNVQNVMRKFSKKVSFPITPKKITAAGYNVEAYVTMLLTELSKADDFDTAVPKGLKNLTSFLSKPLEN